MEIPKGAVTFEKAILFGESDPGQQLSAIGEKAIWHLLEHFGNAGTNCELILFTGDGRQLRLIKNKDVLYFHWSREGDSPT